MKVKYFRLNIVFESSVTVLWALVYVPDGLPIGRLNVAGSQADSVPGALYEPQQFIIASGVYTSQGSSGRRPPCESGRPSQESQSGRRGVPRLAGPNVGLIDPDYHHPQLLELCELNQKRWESLTIPNQAPSGVLGELKKGAKRLGARRPGANEEVPRAHSKGILRSSITPNFGLLAFGLLKKQTLKEVGVLVLPPTSRVWGFPRGSKSKRACEVERLGLNRKKDGEMVPQVSPIELSPNREALESRPKS